MSRRCENSGSFTVSSTYIYPTQGLLEPASHHFPSPGRHSSPHGVSETWTNKQKHIMLCQVLKHTSFRQAHPPTNKAAPTHTFSHTYIHYWLIDMPFI